MLTWIEDSERRNPMQNHDDAFVHALPNSCKKILAVGPYWWFNKIDDIE